jgi:hypothetical protein
VYGRSYLGCSIVVRLPTILGHALKGGGGVNNRPLSRMTTEAVSEVIVIVIVTQLPPNLADIVLTSAHFSF